MSLWCQTALQRHYGILEALALGEDEMPDIKDETLPDEGGLARYLFSFVILCMLNRSQKLWHYVPHAHMFCCLCLVWDELNLKLHMLVFLISDQELLKLSMNLRLQSMAKIMIKRRLKLLLRKLPVVMLRRNGRQSLMQPRWKVQLMIGRNWQIMERWVVRLSYQDYMYPQAKIYWKVILWQSNSLYANRIWHITFQCDMPMHLETTCFLQMPIRNGILNKIQQLMSCFLLYLLGFEAHRPSKNSTRSKQILCCPLQLKDMTVMELKSYLTAHGLPLSGMKEALISRILTHLGKWSHLSELCFPRSRLPSQLLSHR